MKKPVIGITTSANLEGSEGASHTSYRAYSAAIENAGGDPIYLSPGTVSQSNLSDVVREIDGLLLAGGKDVHPTCYPSQNEAGDEALRIDELLTAYHLDCDIERDAYEIPLTRMAYDVQLPLLGICRGFQLLNIVLGGSLIKDIRTGLRHRAYATNESVRHPITLDPHSRLARILGGSLDAINSRHHQGFKLEQTSPLLPAVGFAPDGIVEAVESVEHPWAFAVQWHPERAEDSYIHDTCIPLFKAFVNAAGERRTGHVRIAGLTLG